MATRIGVDVGGTFTDLIFYDERAGEMRVGKEPTTPGAPEEGVLEAVAAARPAGACRRGRVLPARHDRRPQRAARAHAAPRRPARDARASATCSRSAAATATSCTTCSGAARAARAAPPAAARARADPRRRHGAHARSTTRRRPRRASSVFEARGRRRGRGRLPERLRQPGARARRRAALREAGFEGEISLSHQVSGEYREYERTTTTVIDAYVRAAHGRLPRALDDAAARRAASTASLLDHALGRRRDDVRRGRGARRSRRSCPGRSRAPRARPSWRARSASTT